MKLAAFWARLTLSFVPSALRPLDPRKGDWIVREPLSSNSWIIKMMKVSSDKSYLLMKVSCDESYLMMKVVIHDNCHRRRRHCLWSKNFHVEQFCSTWQILLCMWIKIAPNNKQLCTTWHNCLLCGAILSCRVMTNCSTLQTSLSFGANLLVM